MAIISLVSTTGSGFLKEDFDDLKQAIEDGTVSIKTLGLEVGGSAQITSVSTGAADNDKLVTKGYVDDANNSQGNVVGPSSATNNAIVRFDGTTGKILQNSGVTIDDSNILTVTGNKIAMTDVSSYYKYRVWNTDNYAIGMMNAMTFGDLNEHAMTFTMSGHDDRGFIFRDGADAKSDGAFAITTDGRTQAKTSMAIGPSSSDRVVMSYDSTNGLNTDKSITCNISDSQGLNISSTGRANVNLKPIGATNRGQIQFMEDASTNMWAIATDTVNDGSNKDLYFWNANGGGVNITLKDATGAVEIHKPIRCLNGSTNVLEVTSSQVIIGNTATGSSGTAAAPGLAISDTNSGFYDAGGDIIGISCGGNQVGSWQTVGLHVNVQGSAATPSIRIDDANTGFYRPGTNQLGISCNGSQIGKWTTQGLQINGQAWSPITTLTDAATINTNFNNGNVQRVTLAGNRTMAAPTNMKDGATYIFIIKQDATGSRTLTWNSVFKFPGGTAPTLTTTANAVDIISGVSDGTNIYMNFTGDFK